MKQERILIIDALNMYFRAYIVDPSLSNNGSPIGGMKGFLKILQKLCREIRPAQIVVAWDGSGGSQKRKSMQKGYKEGRKPIRLNRDIRNLSENEELENKIWQQARLIEYLNYMPISQIMLPSVEADDVIAQVVQMPSLRGKQKIIVSSDKDFIQLCDDETILYRPTQKEILNKNRIIENYGIHPNNFSLARAICGDKSDNLKGVGGVGLKTIAKRIPMLAEEKSYTLDELVNYCKNVDSDLKAYASIVKKQKVVRENYKLMQLYTPLISIDGKRIVRSSVQDFTKEFNKTQVVKMMIEDGFGTMDWTDLYRVFKNIVVSD